MLVLFVCLCLFVCLSVFWGGRGYFWDWDQNLTNPLPPRTPPFTTNRSRSNQKPQTGLFSALSVTVVGWLSPSDGCLCRAAVGTLLGFYFYLTNLVILCVCVCLCCSCFMLFLRTSSDCWSVDCDNVSTQTGRRRCEFTFSVLSQ